MGNIPSRTPTAGGYTYHSDRVVKKKMVGTGTITSDEVSFKGFFVEGVMIRGTINRNGKRYTIDIQPYCLGLYMGHINNKMGIFRRVRLPKDVKSGENPKHYEIIPIAICISDEIRIPQKNKSYRVANVDDLRYLVELLDLSSSIDKNGSIMYHKREDEPDFKIDRVIASFIKYINMSSHVENQYSNEGMIE